MADRTPVLPNLDPTEDDDIIYFVAELAVQRQLNGLYSSLYASDNDLVIMAANDTAIPLLILAR